MRMDGGERTQTDRQGREDGGREEEEVVVVVVTYKLDYHAVSESR